MSSPIAPGDLTFPTIHMNGTSADSLLDQISVAYGKINEAIAALANAGPNARDYYVQSAGAFDQARTEHDARITRMVAVRDELEAICFNIDEQQNARNRRKA